MSQSSDCIHLALYCDERVKDHLEDDLLGGAPAVWDYIGILLVPESRRIELLSRLLDARCLSDARRPWGCCPTPCRFHDANNTEVHYNEIDKTPKFRVASAWLDFLLQNNQEDLGLVYFYILGVDRSKLDLDRFGPRSQRDRDITLYNRFFRTAVQKSAKMFFWQYGAIQIDTIFHDKGSGETHPLFPWHCIWRLDSCDEKLVFGERQIQFLDSDHRVDSGDPDHSHFLQFIDLVLGCTVNVLHGLSRDKNKLAASRKMEPLVRRIIRSPRNKNSSYHYYGKQAIEFFPRYSMAGYSQDTLIYEMRRHDNFYTRRELRIERLNQPTLWRNASRG